VEARSLTLRILECLRLEIYLSKITQREIERRVGFSGGYLSQLLGGTVELKLWQLLAILHAIGTDPASFFSEAFPRRRSEEVITRLQPEGQGRAKPLSLELARLYGFGIESVADFRERLERCEDALDELADLGFVDETEPESGDRLGAEAAKLRRPDDL